MFPRTIRSATLILCLSLGLLLGSAVLAQGEPEGKGVQSSGRAMGQMMVKTRPLTQDPITPLEADAAIMTQGFEGTWPATGWSRVDQSEPAGFLLGKRNCDPRSGSFAGWMVGGGAAGSNLGCGDNYPNNLDTWAIYGPFDLSAATSAQLTFYIKGQSEYYEEDGNNCFYDYLWVGASTDGTQFPGYPFCGNYTNGSAGNGYWGYVLDLGTDLNGFLGQPAVWIAFNMTSNVNVTFNGLTIDDVRLDVVGAPTCYPLTLTKNGQGSAPTASPAASSGCATGRYIAGQTINLTASAANGWRVGSWQGTNNNSSTANTNTVTMPAAAHTARVNYVQQSGAQSRAVMPFVVYGLTGFLGPLEVEPNSTSGEANGPILFNRNYQGFPNDTEDYYHFQLNSPGQVRVVLTGICGRDPHLHLYYDTPNNRVCYAGRAPYQITYNGQPGTYWVRVYVADSFNSTNLYTLRVNNP